MSVGLVLLADGTALNVVADIGGEAQPPELGSDELAGFKEARVASRCVIMAPFKDRTVEGIVGRDVDTAFVGEDARLSLPVGEVGMERNGNIFMHGLECLQDEGIVSGS